MNKFLLLVMFYSNIVFAVPAALVDAEISVHQKSGKVNTFSGNEYMVVPRAVSKKTQAVLKDLREQLAKAKAQIEATSTTQVIKVLEKSPDKLNRIAFQTGVGPDGLGVDAQEISPRLAPLVGLSYARKLEEYSPWNLGGQVLGGISPKSRTLIGTVSVGYDF
jgi:TolA-binding protein